MTKTGYLHVATSGSFFMATDTGNLVWASASFTDGYRLRCRFPTGSCCGLHAQQPGVDGPLQFGGAFRNRSGYVLAPKLINADPELRSMPAQDRQRGLAAPKGMGRRLA